MVHERTRHPRPQRLQHVRLLTLRLLRWCSVGVRSKSNRVSRRETLRPLSWGFVVSEDSRRETTTLGGVFRSGRPKTVNKRQEISLVPALGIARYACNPLGLSRSFRKDDFEG